MSSAGGRLSWQTTVSVRTSIVPPGPCPPPTDTPHALPVVTTSQVKDSLHDFAVPLRNDPFFLPAGAEAFKRDIPGADVRLLDTGHFALETHAGQIAAAIRGFLAGGAAAG